MATLVQPSPILLLSGLAMILIGLAPVIYWRRKHNTSWKIFGLGAIAWLSVTILEVVMDALISPALPSSLQGASALTSALALGLYVGLRTGFFETGFTLIWARRFRLIDASFNDAVSFGLGFACVGSLALGLNSILGILEILMNPAVMGTLPPSVQQALSAQYALGAAIIGPPIIDRISNMFIYCFAIVVVFMAMRVGRGLFFLAAIYASLADLMAQPLSLVASSTTLVGIYLLEVPYVILGLIGLLGLLRSRTDPVFMVEPAHKHRPHAR
ncbi:MAG: YhfC family glutamic-type intramembrane protease [Conexivisphaerales archaeon]